MTSKLYVGNLPYSATEDSLQDHFTKAGAVNSVKIIMDRDTGRSKGFGFVEMESPEAAEKAVSELDGQEYGGRSLRVSLANPQPERTGGRPGGNRPFNKGPRPGGNRDGGRPPRRHE